MSNIKEKDDNLTVSRVYDTLKSPTFLKNLYWDILSGIKEKNTYKLMRGVAEGLINQNMKGIDGLGNNEADTMRRRAIIAEISVMSYTIDTVFSKILYMKLEKACKEQIVKIIHELRQEGKIPENVWSKINLNAEASGSQTSTDNALVKTNSAQVNKNVQKLTTRVGKRRRAVTSKYIIQDIKRANANKEILDDLAKVNNLKYTDKDESIINDTKGNSSKEKSEGMIKECPKKNTSTTSPTVTATKPNVSMPSNSIDNTTSKDFFESDNQDDSDAESEISIGVESTVSSVHTSDLSSFDDEITLSSDDENGQKKKVPLKEVQKKYSRNNALDSSANTKNGVKSLKFSELQEKSSKKVTEDENYTKEELTDSAAKSTDQSASSPSSNENEFPKRARKPNSKYSSDNIVCPVVRIKERKKPIKTYDKMLNDDLSPPNKKTKVDDVYGDVVTITKSIKNDETSNNIKKPAKQPETLDLFKSQSTNRSLTSRRTAPLTLFST